MAEVGLQEAEGAIPQVVEAEGDAGGLDGRAVLQPDQLQLAQGTGVGDALQQAGVRLEVGLGQGSHQGKLHDELGTPLSTVGNWV